MFLDLGEMDKRQCKAMCGGMGTSGTCAKFIFGEGDSECEKVDFDEKEMQNVFDELNTAEKGDIITLGSSQLGLDEITELSEKLKGRSFKKKMYGVYSKNCKGTSKKTWIYK